VPTIVFFLLVLEHDEVAIIYDNNPYSDKATKRDITTTNYQELFGTANRQTYKTTKYQPSSWFSERKSINYYSIVAQLLS